MGSRSSPVVAAPARALGERSSLELTHEAVGWFVIRVPLLSFDTLVAWPRSEASDGSRGDELGAERAHLRDLVNRPEIREAIFVASPSLFDSMPKWLNAPESRDGRRIEAAVTRYVARMCARATPFGLCAGIALGELGAETRLELDPRSTWRRGVRLDDGLFSLVCQAVTRDPDLRETVRFHPNSTIYPAGGRMRYVETVADGSRTSHRLVAVDPSPGLSCALAAAAGGAARGQLTEALVANGASREEAVAFVEELIESQLLVSEFAPALTGVDGLEQLAAQLRAHRDQAAARAVEAALVGIRALRSQPFGVSPAAYRQIAEPLRSLVDVGPGVVQVDMIVGAHATLPRHIATEALRAIELLRRAGLCAEPPELGALARFRERFSARYESRELPLAEVLDEEFGIGFGPSNPASAEGSPLLEGLPLSGPEAAQTPPLHPVLPRLLDEALRERKIEVQIPDELIRGVGTVPAPPYPDTFALFMIVVAGSWQRVASGDYRVVLTGIEGPSGARMAARFCGATEGLEQRVRALLAREERQRQAVVFAEIVHVPEGRTGNIAHRPVLRAYEIPFGARAGVSRDFQILVSDLTVAVHGQRVVLRSRRLDREVLPRLTNAHASQSPWNLTVYRFLAALQAQDAAMWPPWSWASLRQAPFLPRVGMGRVVLAQAQWRLSPADVALFLDATHPGARLRQAKCWQSELGLPRFVSIGAADVQLPVDLDNPLMLDAAATLMHRGRDCRLREVYPLLDGMCVTGPGGRFVHEIMVPFARAAGPPAARAPTATRRRPGLTSSDATRFIPGSEWVYAKLYTGSSSVDGVLHYLAPLVRSALGDCVDRWFFVRYSDPEWHVRLRFHGSASRLASELVPRLTRDVAQLVEAGWVSRVVFDTYEPETRRYGGNEGLLLAERFFEADSELGLGLIEVADAALSSELRWQLALLSVVSLLDDLAFPVPVRLELMRAARAAYGLEFRVNRTLTQALAARYRKLRASVEAIVAGEAMTSGESASLFREPFKRRSAVNRILAAELRQLREHGTLECELADYSLSLVHMALNRMLRWAHRPQELVLCDFLEQAYRSSVARGSRGPDRQAELPNLPPPLTLREQP